MEAYIGRGRFTVSLKYDLLMMMSLSGSVCQILSRDFIVCKKKPSMRALDLELLVYD